MNEEMNVGESPADEVVINAMPAVGAQLRAARENRKLSLQDVANALKLGVRQVEALESGEWQVLPGATFVRGFVRNYARLVLLDAVPLMVQLDSTLVKPVVSLGENDAPQARMPQAGSAVSRRDRMVMLSGGALVVVATLVYFLLPNDLSDLRASTQGLIDSFARKETPAPTAAEPVFPPGTTPQQVMNPQAEPPVAVESSSPAASTAPANDKMTQVPGAPVMRFAFEKESWVEVRDRDNKVIFSQRSQAGAEQTVSGQGPYSLVIGFAPGVKLFWHGQAIDLVPYTRGDVARLVLE